MRFLKDLAIGVGVLAALAVPIAVWIGVPMIWMSYDDGAGMEFTTLGQVWVYAPLAVITVGVVAWFGRAIRTDTP